MIEEVAIPVRRSKFFNLEYFGNQVPWYGPYINDGQHHLIVSSALKEWPPDADYDLMCWIFDESGNIVGEKLVGQKRQGSRPVTVNLKESLSDLPPMRGMIALLLRPVEDGFDVPSVAQAWVVRICNNSGISEVIANGSSKTINFPELTGRRATFRLFSSALMIGEGWRSLAVVMNVSANPSYATTVNLNVHVFNKKGERLDAPGGAVPPFGTVWIDVSALFGGLLPEFLASSDGRGSYTIESDDGASIGYHFLYQPKTGKFAGDHTRPLMAYIPKGYGIGRFTTGRPTISDFLRHARFVSTQLLKR